MKKFFVACTAIAAVMAFTACGSSKESAYRKAYEKAKAQEMAGNLQDANNQSQNDYQYQEPVQSQNNSYSQNQSDYQEVETPVVTQLVEAPANNRTVTNNSDNVAVRTESVQVVSGTGLKAYSVVVGSFGVKANAENLQTRLKNAGYASQIAYNSSNKMYRVIVSTFDSKSSAVDSRNSIRATYPDAWLLMKQ